MDTASHRNVFVAGAGGAIGSVLCRLLVADGWTVTGTTRTPARTGHLESLGVHPVVVDVFDRHALIEAVHRAGPDVVVHQLTDLPRQFSESAMVAARIRNARLREIGTAHLVEAADRAGAGRIVAQSIAFAYAPGPLPWSEASPLDRQAHPAVVRLEEQVLAAAAEGVVLRYGRLYGPGTWSATPPVQMPLHVDAAADAARRAMTLARPGIYNVAEDDPALDSTRIRESTGWDPGFRLRREA
jgi:nucleoside-diphosphate-sugar epimerase